VTEGTPISLFKNVMYGVKDKSTEWFAYEARFSN